MALMEGKPGGKFVLSGGMARYFPYDSSSGSIPTPASMKYRFMRPF
jgi:hypothetical protein